MKKEDFLISAIATAIAVGWIFTTFSVQQRYAARSHSHVQNVQFK